ncbi:hypothetical protein [Salibacterium aidingense]
MSDVIVQALTGAAIFAGGIAVICAAMPDSRAEIAEIVRKKRK